MTLTFAHYLTLSWILFLVGMAGLLTRRHGLVVLLCLLLMANAAHLLLIAAARLFADGSGQGMVVLAWFIWFAEGGLGLAVLGYAIRARGTENINAAHYLKR